MKSKNLLYSGTGSIGTVVFYISLYYYLFCDVEYLVLRDYSLSTLTNHSPEEGGHYSSIPIDVCTTIEFHGN